MPQISRYFPPGTWKPEYEKYPRILYAPTLSADWPRLSMVRAIYQQITYSPTLSSTTGPISK